MSYRQLLGAQGEKFVADFLSGRGYQILDRNWRIKSGEIDLVAQDVKTRSSEKFGHPLEAITPDKAARLQRLALGWLITNESWGVDFAIDCVGVIRSATGEFTMDYRSAVL
jgi:putative endonuclease